MKEKDGLAVNKVLNLNSRDRNILVKSPLMATLGPGSLNRMLELATVLSFEARDILFREGDPADYFYCVLTGYVRLYRLNKDGREADIRISGGGDTFAESLLAMGDTYHYNAQAAEHVTVARFDLAKVRQLAEQENDIARSVIRCLSNYLRSTMDCIANDRLQTAPQRVAQYLIDNCPNGGGAVSIRLPFQKSLLAGKLGLAPEALSRAFSTLRHSGVTVRGRMVQINDVNTLRQI
ncbi:cyclic nucleotide-binding domain-containing protein [Agrobacterium vitis]|uniref:Cyclic nucleotide-binding domain-containing protein n=1 Tax=Agrobacterium vitis TaxID=373 RepID=A0AAE4WUM4_AGRVI|nr:Crp/Fnr family transcriptional regulator [Allorhizobium sp. Av2]MUO78029.1 cyclic nucleotide-binding domain-containing protein [Agrobacterium vitis]MUO97185.1 cyclic nucleotide-binding domain-containing protein [Agrobacterium vitis]MUP03639.1 cyclic nucleotide-binding domain-containing protein [Agrobacterium vitis]MUZ56087.1 cyclic nucleotide-binding domain-containing protein [Agrobacterium vitis]